MSKIHHKGVFFRVMKRYKRWVGSLVQYLNMRQSIGWVDRNSLQQLCAPWQGEALGRQNAEPCDSSNKWWFDYCHAEQRQRCTKASDFVLLSHAKSSSSMCYQHHYVGISSLRDMIGARFGYDLFTARLFRGWISWWMTGLSRRQLRGCVSTSHPTRVIGRTTGEMKMY